MREKTTFVSVRHIHVEGGRAATAHSASTTFFCVEVIVARDPGNDLAVLGHAKAF